MKFEEMNIHPNLLKAIKHLGYEEPTEIQARSIPLLQQGKDLVGQSSTGSGKTAAFGLPLLEKIVPGKGVQALVLTPTRELCVQDADTLLDLGKFMSIKVAKVFGGVGFSPQVDAILSSEIVVGTPGRVLDHLRQETLNLGKINFLILDEADKMFEMGFVEDVELIIGHTPLERQTVLFSATMSDAVVTLVQKHLRSPVDIRVEAYVDKSLLKQIYYDVDQREKFSLLVHLLKNKISGLAMVFCATRHEVDSLTRNLRHQGIKAMAIHGGLSQNKRLFALEKLRQEDIDVLVATDVAARGLDIRNVSSVYNYDVPKTAEEYIHRVGRTARAGDSGEAVTLLSQRDYDNYRHVESDRSLEIKKEVLPEFVRLPFVRDMEQRGFEGGRGGERRGFSPQSRDSSSNSGPPRHQGLSSDSFSRGPSQQGVQRSRSREMTRR
ncbi:MAG: DEAD/DEAH box helicase [Nanoarchaeota archaeon]